MTNAVVQRTKHIEESYALQYGAPALGNAVGWEECSGRVNVCAERMVVVFEASNETGRRDDAGVGLLRWRQGVPVLGQPMKVFEAYAAELSKEVVEQESARMLSKELSKKADDAEGEGGKKKASVSRGAVSDVGRGRDAASVRAVVQCCAREAAALGACGAVAACQALDEAYWTGSLETPRVLAAAWSPPMCGGDDGLGCMVAVCFDDGSLMLFSKPGLMTAFWVPELNLSRVHVDIAAFQEAKKKRVVQDVVFPGTFLGVVWSKSFKVEATDSSRTYSVIGGITELGELELFRMAHNALGDRTPAGVQSRVVHVGTVRLRGECITQAALVVSAESGNAAEIVAVCGCESGAVMACSVALSDHDVPGIDSKRVDLVEKVESLLSGDQLMVTSLAVTCASGTCPAGGIERQVTIAIGKTVGTIQVFIGGAAGTLMESIKDGEPASVPEAARPDMHSISGLAFLTSGRLLVASSRLGNMVTLRVPDMELVGNPVHHHTRGGNNLQYQGFGCYGLAASPGGAFVALAKQSHEPDREFRMQQQIHQMVTQGYLHIQSVVRAEGTGPDGDVVMTDADVSSPGALLHMSEALKTLVFKWVDSSSPAGALWDAGRMAALLENLLPHGQMTETLLAIQREAGVSHTGNDGTLDTWSLNDVGERTYRFAAAMMHVLRALQGDYRDQLVRIADWELISMKGHILSIFSQAKHGVENTATAKLTGLLAIDLVVSAHGSHPWIFPKALVDQATVLYAAFGGDESPILGRPISTDLDDKFVAPITTALDGSAASMDQALMAQVVDSSGEPGDPFVVMRCPATLQGNLDGGAWICSSCKRSYGSPPHPTHLGLEDGTVACTLCASKVCADIPYYI